MKILFADDDATYLRTCIQTILRGCGVESIDVAVTIAETRAKVKSGTYDLIILDIDFGAGEETGLDLIQEILCLQENAEVIVHSTHGDFETIRRAINEGASEFISKSSGIESLMHSVAAFVFRSQTRDAVAAQAKKLAQEVKVIYRSPAMEKIFVKFIKLRSARDVNILIRGETGTGKDLVAQAFRQVGRPFVVVNCGAFASENLVESEIFGHVRGAFTGATHDRVGLIEGADGGDVYFDEVARLPLSTQAGLLRVLENKEIKRLGCSVTKKVSFRVIAATNEDLEELVKRGLFREDLLARLKGTIVRIPPLRDRREDILPIADHTIGQSDRPHLTLGRDCAKVLENLAWPENVRQLRQTMKTMIATTDGDVITLYNLPKELLGNATGCTGLNDDQTFRLTMSRNGITYDAAKRELLWALINLKVEEFGPRATENQIARSLDVSRQTVVTFLQKEAKKDSGKRSELAKALLLPYTWSPQPT